MRPPFDINNRNHVRSVLANQVEELLTFNKWTGPDALGLEVPLASAQR